MSVVRASLMVMLMVDLLGVAMYSKNILRIRFHNLT
jgi:hypothetical protein